VPRCRLCVAGGETRDRGIEPSHPRPMGDRQILPQVRAEARPGPVRRGLGGSLEQHDSRRDKDAQARHDGPQGLPRRGPDHEEAPTREAHSALRRLHDGGADLHHYGAHEERKLTRVLARYARAPSLATSFFPIVRCLLLRCLLKQISSRLKPRLTKALH
jgi:hypothetical protein